MALLSGFRVTRLGDGLAAAVCGRILADLGAAVAIQAASLTAEDHDLLRQHLVRGPVAAHGLSDAHLIVAEGSPSALRDAGWDAATLRARAPTAAIVLISPFGQTGPRAEDPATDLTLFYDSGIARMLTGQVDDLSEAPIRPVG
ncbi:MAG: CoA transferase, partial [Proteobacteria bacterium]|nr:CoA transferase [Pseudomonadota bacterium]